MKPTEHVERKPDTLIYRQVSFDVEAFELLKGHQREMEARLRRTVTNSEALCDLLKQRRK